MESSNSYPKYDIRRVREMTQDELTRTIAVNILPYCYTVGGNAKPHDADLEIIAGVLAGDLLDEMNDYRSLFIEEVKRALWDGSKGKFGDVYGTNIRSFEGFFAKYKGSDFQSKLRPAVAAEARKWGPKQLSGGRRQLTDDEIYAQTMPYVLRMVEDVKAGKSKSELFPYYGAKIYEQALSGTVNNKEIPKAYVRYSCDHDLWEEAEFLDREFRRMGLYAAI